MRRGSRRITLRVPEEILDRLYDETPFQPGPVRGYRDLSNWIRTAIVQRLDHLGRSRKAAKKKGRIVCTECDKTVSTGDVDCSWVDLLGRQGYRCIKCANCTRSDS
jgi:hypothetical protein